MEALQRLRHESAVAEAHPPDQFRPARLRLSRASTAVRCLPGATSPFLSTEVVHLVC